MTVKEVHEWCRKNRIDARGFIRGGEFLLRHDDGAAAAQPAGEILHWQLTINGEKYPTSTSDLGRLMAGKIAFDDFIQSMARTARRGGE